MALFTINELHVDSVRNVQGEKNRLVQQGEIISVCSENHIKFITTVWEQNANFFKIQMWGYIKQQLRNMCQLSCFSNIAIDLASQDLHYGRSCSPQLHNTFRDPYSAFFFSICKKCRVTVGRFHPFTGHEGP